MTLLARLDQFALWFRRRPVRESGEYVSEVADSIHRLSDMLELAGDALFAIAGGIHTDNPEAQRNMAAVFKEDALNRYQDVLKKLEPEQRRQMDEYITGICKGKQKR